MAMQCMTTYITIPVDGTNTKAAKNASFEEAKVRLQCDNPELVSGDIVRTSEAIPRSEENPLGSPGTFEYRACWRHMWDDTPAPEETEEEDEKND